MNSYNFVRILELVVRVRKPYIRYTESITGIKEKGSKKMLLEIHHLKKTYRTRFSKEEVPALQDIDFKVEEGEFIAIMGESGSGKTTLLNMLATLDKPTNGSILLNNQEITSIKESDLADFRLKNLGFVFQDFHLLDTLSIQDNIFLPLVLARVSYDEMQKRLAILAPQLGIEKLLHKRPFELSGGQKQRIAIARSLITNPKIVLADEPTAALDYRTSEELLTLFETINQQGQTILMVTHSANAASHANRVLFIKDGRIFHQLYKANKSNQDFLKEISISMFSLLGGQ